MVVDAGVADDLRGNAPLRVVAPLLVVEPQADDPATLERGGPLWIGLALEVHEAP
jgi:hypothetical protein